VAKPAMAQPGSFMNPGTVDLQKPLTPLIGWRNSPPTFPTGGSRWSDITATIQTNPTA